MNKLKALLPPLGQSGDRKPSNRSNNNEKLLPVVGFKLTLDPGSCIDYDNGNEPPDDGGNRRHSAAVGAIPELQVHLIGARHLPVSFGLKSVEGYMVKVKLFPGATKFDSTIETNSWPTFDETFRFPLITSQKSSFRVKKSDKQKERIQQTLPEKYFNGTFVVFTVFALLELPPGYTTSLKTKTMSFIRQGSQRLKDKPVIGKLVKEIDPEDPSRTFDRKATQKKLTTSESQRNLGSVTYFLEPKFFTENVRTKTYGTEEQWLPIRDISITQPSESRITITSSPRGQVEVTLQLCDYTEVNLSTTPSQEDCSFNVDGPYAKPGWFSSSSVRSHRKNPSGSPPVPATSAHKNRFSFDMRKIVRSVKNKEKNQDGLCLKIGTSKMRCSIKVKEQFEGVGEKVYLKTSVLEHSILAATWKTEPFRPTLSSRWKEADSTIVIPLTGEAELEHLSIKVALATKNKLGKKVRLGTVYLGPQARDTDTTKQDQWRKMIAYKGSPISAWYSFDEPE